MLGWLPSTFNYKEEFITVQKFNRRGRPIKANLLRRTCRGESIEVDLLRWTCREGLVEACEEVEVLYFFEAWQPPNCWLDQEDKVSIKQPEGFLLSYKEDYVFKLKKALNGLKQAPRAWFSRLDSYLKKQGYKRGVTDSNLYIKFEGKNMIIVIIYVDDIIFGINLQMLNENFAYEMKKEFEMSMLGELTFFLGLQVSQLDKGIFISQTKYIK